jgi:hypothetical protein
VCFYDCLDILKYIVTAAPATIRYANVKMDSENSETEVPALHTRQCRICGG